MDELGLKDAIAERIHTLLVLGQEDTVVLHGGEILRLGLG